MIKSMTGFASLTHEDEHATIAVTVRAVNHRFLDLQLRVPHAFGDVEPRLRALLQKRLARGRVEIGISVQVRDLSTPTVELNLEVAQALSAAIEQARAQGLVSGTLSPGDLAAPAPGDRGARTIDRRRSRARSAYCGEHRSRRRAGAGRSGCHARPRRHPSGGRSRFRRLLLVDLIEHLRVAADQGRGALGEPAARADRGDPARAAGRSRDDRPGDRPRRGAFGHLGRGHAGFARTWLTGGRWLMPTSPAAANSTSCCRR